MKLRRIRGENTDGTQTSVDPHEASSPPVPLWRFGESLRTREPMSLNGIGSRNTFIDSDSIRQTQIAGKMPAISHIRRTA